MMRVTNSMIVKRTKTNINNNRSKVDYTNNQMSTQKKITKPSDNPIIAIRSLRLRSTLSTITQYYENNIPDAESWMDCTETALTNMKDLLTDAYSRVVYGATDELETEDRQTILKALQSLQQQIYCEGNADYARRTVFTGYKTDQNLTFMSNAEAKDEHYEITEKFDYRDVEKKNYYANGFDDTSDENLKNNDPEVFQEVELNRLRLAYDKISEDGNSLTISYKDKDGNPVSMKLDKDGTTSVTYLDSNGGTASTVFGTDGKATVSVLGGSVSAQLDAAGSMPAGQPQVVTQPPGYHIGNDNGTNLPVISTATDANGNTVRTYTYNVYTEAQWNDYVNNGTALPNLPTETVNFSVTTPAGGGTPMLSAAGAGKAVAPPPVTYRVTDTTSLRDADYQIGANEIVFDRENGELIFSDTVAEFLDTNRADIRFDYDKQGFEEGELRPEYYFNCKRYMKDRDDITYENFDEKGNWLTQGIFYNIAGGQQMQINTEAHEVFNSDIRRDIDELIDIVSTAITAQTTADEIKKKIDSGNYEGDDLKKLENWYDAAKKQLDYAKQNMHDTYSSYISRFQGYLDDVDLEITDLGGRGERVTLTKNRMSVQRSTFKELKSINEDMDLSDLVINYTAASVAYQCALQAAAKIGKMTLLDFI